MSQLPPNDNPYAAPTGPGDYAPPPEEMRRRVAAPAMTLVIFAGVAMALQALGLVGNLVGAGVQAAAAGDDPAAQVQNLMSGTLGLVSSGIGLAVGALILYGGLQMRNLQSWGLAMASSILAMIPCISPCCVFGLPIGIWCLVVLNDVQVKRSFVS